MRICRAGFRAFEIPLVTPLSTAHGPIVSRSGYLLTLMDEEGRCGYGEATPLPDFGTEDLLATRRALEEALVRLVDARIGSVDETLASISQSCVEKPCALSAIDSALHDLEARRLGLTLPKWIRDRAGLSGEPSERIFVQTLVPAESPEEIATCAKTLVDEGFKTFKLKLAVSKSRQDLGFDLDRVAALRDAIGSAHRIRLDANGAWTLRDAQLALESLERFEIDYIEQPVAPGDLADLKELTSSAAIPVAADEALLHQGWEACLDSRAASIFVVKPAALGGIAVSLALSSRARELGIRVIWSSLIDAAVGRASAIALASALDCKAEVHGLGTARLLVRDLIESREGEAGVIEPSQALGLGCNLAPIWHDREYVEDRCWGEAWIAEERP